MGSGRWIWVVCGLAVAMVVVFLAREAGPPAKDPQPEPAARTPSPPPTVPPADGADEAPGNVAGAPVAEVPVAEVPGAEVPVAKGPVPSAPLDPAPSVPPLPSRREPAAPRVEAPGENVDAAWEDLRQLQRHLKSPRSINEEILAYLDVVSARYHGKEWSAAETERHKYAKAAEKAFLKAFELTKIFARSRSNIRADVNVRAAQILGETGNPKLVKPVIKGIESHHMRAKHAVSVPLWEAAFEALAKLGHEDALAWMIEEFIHTKSSPPEHIDQLEAAHRTMVRFERPSGALRYELVRQMVKTYTGVESQALGGDADAERFWNRIRTGVLLALQHYTGKPTDDRGEALVTMAEFSQWFRAHKNPKRAPWID